LAITDRGLSRWRLKLHPHKTFIAPCREPTQFLGLQKIRQDFKASRFVSAAPRNIDATLKRLDPTQSGARTVKRD
jgi:hypothetical protein